MNLSKLTAHGLSLLVRRLPLGRLPSWPYLLGAAALALVGHWLGEWQIVAPLRELSEALLADLKVLNPMNAVGGYYFNLTGCTVAFADGSVTGNCDATGAVGTQMQRYGLNGSTSVFWPMVMLLQTVLEIWQHSGWMGRAIYVLTLPLGMYAAGKTVDRIGDNPDEEWSVIGWVMFAALIPLFAGFAALALQWLLIVLLWLFGKALAAIVWLITVAAAPFAYARQTLGILKQAKELEAGHANLTGDAKD